MQSVSSYFQCYGTKNNVTINSAMWKLTPREGREGDKVPKHHALAHPWEKCPGGVLSSQARSRGDWNVLALNLLSALLRFFPLSSHGLCTLASLSSIPVFVSQCRFH